MVDDKTKRMCPNGHVMEPDWDVCPYCPSSRVGGQELAKTVRIEDAAKEAPPPPIPEARKTELFRVKPSIGAVAWRVGVDGPLVGTVHTIQSDKVTVGGTAGNDVQISDSHVSDQHASLRFKDGSFTLTDLDSTNGTYVNGKKVAKKVLADGDQVKIGSSGWIFKFVHWESQ